MRLAIAAILVCIGCVGCGTTKWTDTTRTATEQLLLSDSMERAVSRLDFRSIAGKKVFLDATPISSMTDNAYLASLIRQHMLASGAILKEKREEADYIVELRAGAIGTDRHDLLFGVPALSLPVAPVPGVPSQIPEIPLIKRTDQRGVAKISVFVYNRNTGRIVWQSGVVPEESRAKAVWFLGAGPFQRGSIYDGTKFAGDRIDIPLIDLGTALGTERSRVSVAEEAYFVEPPAAETMTKKTEASPPSNGPATTQANGTVPSKGSGPPADGQSVPAPGHPAKDSGEKPGAGPGEGVIPAGHTSPEGPAGAEPATHPSGPATTGPAQGPAVDPGPSDDRFLPPSDWRPPEGSPNGVHPLPPVNPSERPYPHFDPWPYYRR